MSANVITLDRVDSPICIHRDQLPETVVDKGFFLVTNQDHSKWGIGFASYGTYFAEKLGKYFGVDIKTGTTGIAVWDIENQQENFSEMLHIVYQGALSHP